MNSEEPSQEGASIDFDVIVAGDDEDVSEAPLDKVRAYAERLGATLASSEKGHAFINGKHFNMDDVSLRLNRAIWNTKRYPAWVRISCAICKWKSDNSCSIYRRRFTSSLSETTSRADIDFLFIPAVVHRRIVGQRC